MLLDETSSYLRDPRVVAVTSRSCLMLISERGEVLTHTTSHAGRWSTLLQRLSQPATGAGVAGLAASIPDLTGELWQRLLDAGYIVAARDPEALMAVGRRAFRDNQGFHFDAVEPVCEHLLLACTGSVVAGLMAPTILSLQVAGAQNQLDVILTESARKFVTRDLLESYGIRTWTAGFERRDGIHVAHVELGRSADCILVMPATANSVYRIANGACTDLLSTTIAASEAPVVLVPAMNETMWNNRAVQRNAQRLRDDGMFVVEPTVIVGAADMAAGASTMYGGHGTMWAGPRSLIHTLDAILRYVPDA